MKTPQHCSYCLSSYLSQYSEWATGWSIMGRRDIYFSLCSVQTYARGPPSLLASTHPGIKRAGA
jgi:hypothetical protein